MPTADDLRRLLARLDGRGYKAYAELRGRHALPGLDLHVDHVQGDPFAAPSKVRLRVPMETARLPTALAGTHVRRVALADFLARALRTAVAETRGRGEDEAVGAARAAPGHARGRAVGPARRGGGSGKSGLVLVDAGGQTVLERTAVRLDDDFVEARLEVGLPAAGRRILGHAAAHLLLERLPRIAEQALHAERLDLEQARLHVDTVDNHAHLQRSLAAAGLVAFVADGAVLPRESGASDRPLGPAHALPFRSPESLRVELPLLHAVPGPDGPRRTLVGMGVPAGVTLIVGGGYHGKSTLLRALECGVYPHVPGDGREYVVSAPDLVKIRAEDGRSVVGVDIHGFIDRLPAAPGLPDAPARTRRFSTSDASGSTSQAAAIVEAIESGAHGLLLDEDTSATNFMLRDARMQRLVHAGDEPITPFIDRVRELYDAFGVSTVLVMGGSGDYFDVADTVVRMRAYEPEDATAESRAIARDTPTGRVVEHPDPMGPVTPRVPHAAAFDAARGRRDVRISARDHETVLYGEHTIDLRHVTQLVDTSQTRAAALAIHLASRRFMTGSHARGDARVTLAEVLDAVEALIDAEGLDVLDPFRRAGRGDLHPGNLARPRRYEIAATLNRLRTLELAPDHD